ncbi:hypothetical protein NKG94_49595 [Micromonospora sp. M12]
MTEKHGFDSLPVLARPARSSRSARAPTDRTTSGPTMCGCGCTHRPRAAGPGTGTVTGRRTGCRVRRALRGRDGQCRTGRRHLDGLHLRDQGTER